MSNGIDHSKINFKHHLIHTKINIIKLEELYHLFLKIENKTI